MAATHTPEPDVEARASAEMKRHPGTPAWSDREQFALAMFHFFARRVLMLESDCLD